MGVQGDNSSWQGPGAGPMAEGEAEPHERSRKAERAKQVEIEENLRRTQKSRSQKWRVRQSLTSEAERLSEQNKPRLRKI